jgi:hypothetical protein
VGADHKNTSNASAAVPQPLNSNAAPGFASQALIGSQRSFCAARTTQALAWARSKRASFFGAQTRSHSC